MARAVGLASQVEGREGGVVGLQGGQLVSVDGGRGVWPEPGGGRQRRSDAAAQAVGLALPPLVLNRRLQG